MARLVKGDKFPNFTVDTVYEDNLTIEQIMGGKQTYFWFLRYIGCPPCRLDVHMLMDNYAKFTEKGINVVIVMQSKPEIVRRDMNDAQLPFYLICDYDQKLYKELELGSSPEGQSFADIKFTETEQKRLAMKMEGMQKLGIVHGDYEGNEQQLPGFFDVLPDMTVAEAHYAENPMDNYTVYELLDRVK